MQDVIDHEVVLLLEARVRDAGHHRELLVRVRQLAIELDEVVDSGVRVVIRHNDLRLRSQFSNLRVGYGAHPLL